MLLSILHQTKIKIDLFFYNLQHCWHILDIRKIFCARAHWPWSLLPLMTQHDLSAGDHFQPRPDAPRHLSKSSQIFRSVKREMFFLLYPPSADTAWTLRGQQNTSISSYLASLQNPHQPRHLTCIFKPSLSPLLAVHFHYHYRNSQRPQLPCFSSHHPKPTP